MRFEILRTTSTPHGPPPHPRAVADGDKWVIDLADLDDLLSFEPEMSLIVWKNANGFPVVEIYDDYRE